MYRRILVPLDGSRFGEAALGRAIELAERLEAALELATVANPEVPGDDPDLDPDPEVGDDVRDVARRHAREYLEDVKTRLRAGGFAGESSHAVIPAGNVAHSLVSHLHEKKCDLAVMATHGRGPLKRAWLGSTADAFIRRAPIPVLLIRPEEPEDETEDADAEPTVGHTDLSGRPEPFERALFPLDGSGEAEAMLETTVPLLSGTPEGECLLLRVLPPFIPGGPPYLPHVVREVESQATMKKAARDYLDGVIGDSPCARTEGKVVTDGQVGLAILRVAEDEGADLIAVSTAGRGGVTRLLLGSVADEVVRGSEIPVLVYRIPPES